jgi:hypothetical protein
MTGGHLTTLAAGKGLSCPANFVSLFVISIIPEFCAWAMEFET